MEQGNVAKKLTGQILENWLLTLADGHGGIQTITKTGTSGLVDTYTIAFADETTSTFTVTNGRSISGLTTSKSGKVTTITITYNDNTTSSFTVRDGENVSSITEYWAVSTSGSQQPQSGWQTTPPTLTATYKYLWHYSKYTFSDGTNTSTTPAVQGVYGDKGDTGNTGTSITSVTKTGTSGLVDTYTITFSNGTTTTFNVTNGSEIESIEKTSTAGLVDTYTVTMGSGDTHTFTVTNGRSIVSFTQTSGTHAAGTIDVYTMTYNDGDTSQIQVYNGANGTGAVSTVAGIGVSSADGDVPLIIKGYGAPTTATVGQVNQLYFDMTGGIMYICIASAGGSYDWRGMSSAVDSAMSTTSANPLQNRVISNKVGVGSLSSEFSATNLTDAANELQTNKAEKTATVSTVTYDSTNHKLTKTINGTTSDVVTAAALKSDMAIGAGDVSYNSSTTYSNDTVGKAVSDLNGAINDLTANDIANNSNVTGTKVKDALNTLSGAIDEVSTRATVDPANLTNNWLLTAKGGEYQVSGDSLTGSFLEGAYNSWGVMKVVFTPANENGAYGYIVYIPINGTVYVREFRRDSTAITWRTDLLQIVKRKDYEFSKNGTFYATGFGAIGFITSSSTNVTIDFDVDYRMDDISTVTVTTLNGSIRSEGSYLDASGNTSVNFLSSTYSVSAAKRTQTRVRISIIKSTAFTNAVNNSLVYFTGTIGLKFT